MTSPNRSVIVRLTMDPSSYMAGATRAAGATTALQREVAKVGPTTETSMSRAAKSTSAAETSMGRLNKTAGALGFTLGGLAGVGGALAVAMSVKWAADYQSALTRLVTTAGESQKNIKMVGQGFLDMAGQVGISADEIAKGAYIAESAGYHGAAALTVMKAASQGARQENADLSKVTDALSTALHDYHLPASDAAKVTSELITAVSHGKTTFDELTGSLHSVTPLASKMGISLADVTGTLSAMTASGESADQATQNMANTLQHLASPTLTMINELAQLGISTDDLQNSLSTKGLAGTLQMVEEAIVQHVDPATQRVLLPALNKSKTAVQDLNIMLGQMPPSLAKLSQGLIDGQVSFKDYRKAVQDLGGPQSAMGKQFLSLYESSQGFNSVLKQGGPAAQVFTAAMQKSFGTTAALNVALQTTGENAAATNNAIRDIAKAAPEASGDIKGWSEVQGNFNQQIAQSEAHIKSMAIEAGQHLLPALTGALGYVNRDVIPGIEHMGSVAGDAAHLFGELPAPVRDTVLALAGLKTAMKINFLGLSTAVTATKTSFAGLRDEMAVQQALFAAEQRSAAETAASFGRLAAGAEAATAGIAGLATAEEGAVVGMGTMNAAASTLAMRGMAGVKAAGSGLMSMFGGPWGIAMIAGVIGITSVTSALDAQKQAEAAAKTSGEELYNTYVKLGTIYGQQADAARETVKSQNDLNDIAKRAGVSQQTLTLALEGNVTAQKKVTDATGGIGDRWHALWSGSFGDFLSGNFMDKDKKVWEQIVHGLGVNTSAAGLLMNSIDNTKGALEDYQTAAQRIFGDGSIANRGMDTLTKGMDELAKSTGSSESSLQGITDILAGLTGQGASAAQAAADLTTATIDTSNAFAQMSKGAVDAKGNLDLSSEAGVGLWNSLKDVSDGFKTAVNDSYAAAGGINNAGAASKAAGKTAQTLYEKFILTATGAGMSQEAAEKLATQLGLVPGDVVTKFTQPGMTESQGAADLLKGKVLDIPDTHTVHTSALTSEAMTLLGNLGFTVKTLPDGTVDVTANTNPARQAIAQLSNDYKHFAINVGIGGTFGRAAAATGAILPGFTPGRDVHRFVSSSAGMALDLSGGEGIARPEVVQAMGPGRFMGLNAAARSGGVSGVRKALGFADGGFFPGMHMIAQVGIDPSSMAAAEQAIKSALSSPYAGMVLGGSSQQAVQLGARMAMARGWTGPQWTALFNLWMRESGWNPYAVNKSSGAYGIPQALGHGHVFNLGDSAAQEAWGMNYIASVYGTPANAWAHETRVGWYDQGGPWPSGTVGINTSGKTEMVRTADQEASVQRALRSREMFGGAFGGHVVHTTVNNNTYQVAAAGPSEKQLVRALANHQYQQEFLHG